jgi:hypothetical protein
VAVVNQIVFDGLPIGQAVEAGPLDGTGVHEHILAAVVGNDEAEATNVAEKNLTLPVAISSSPPPAVSVAAGVW